MFHTLAPQRVHHDDGYIVQVADRHHVEYLDGSQRWVVEVEFAPVVGIYRDTLGSERSSATDFDTVLRRIAAGLEAMGSNVEVC
jgi:sporulation-control protein spo0M